MQALQVYQDTFLPNGQSIEAELVHEYKAELPGRIQYHYAKYRRSGEWEENALLDYQPPYSSSWQGITLYYFLSPYQSVSLQSWGTIDDKEGFEILTLHFTPEYLKSCVDDTLPASAISRLLLAEPSDNMRLPIMLCHKKMGIVKTLQQMPADATLQTLFLQAHAQMLLLYSLEACELPGAESYTFCRVSPQGIHHEKILQAKDILLQRLGDPITIPELSRKVAMNECYLKKGFKEMVGCTIFEFYQQSRMQYARTLLCEKGLTVTEVSDLLGYSSISHFSTAFKKHTGLKPCELLMR